MTTLLDVQQVKTKDDDSLNIHLMPCNINYNGECKTDAYFETTVRKNDEGMPANNKQEAQGP